MSAQDSRPVPTDSATARRIARFEEVLARLRQVALEVNVADKFFVNDVSRGSKESFLKDVVLTREAPDDMSAHYWYASKEWRRTSRGVETFEQDHGPTWVKLAAEQRLLWARHLPALLASLEGLAISVSSSISWRWDRVNCRPGGQPRYVPRYQVLIHETSSGAGFEPKKWLPQLLDRICVADHPLADEHLFDWQKDTVGQTLFSSYSWAQSGFQAYFETRKAAELASKVLFSDLTHTLSKQAAQGEDPWWQVDVDLSTSPLEFLVRKELLIEKDESLL